MYSHDAKMIKDYLFKQKDKAHNMQEWAKISESVTAAANAIGVGLTLSECVWPVLDSSATFSPEQFGIYLGITATTFAGYIASKYLMKKANNQVSEISDIIYRTIDLEDAVQQEELNQTRMASYLNKQWENEKE